ncbi:HNH endonuclease family protein [Pseudohongiella acticola]|nr:HNH endonuclease family protein [Pseudohongiella acticola]
MDTRHEVLLSASRIPATLDAGGCNVLSGEWYDPFTGQVFTDPGELDIDHMVPLEEAHGSGAHAWGSDRKRAYANDLLNAKSLIAVSASANRSKGSRGPAEWLPPNTAHHCEYVRNWTEVKHRHGLDVDDAEKAAVESVLGADIALAVRAESSGWDEIQRAPSPAVFGLGIRKQDQCSYTRQALPSDQIEVTVSILPDPNHIERKFDIFLVADLPAGLFSLDMWGNFIPFNGDIATLVPHRENIYLAQSHEISVFTGALNDELVMNLFIGYGTDSGDFVYTSAPLPLAIKE